MVQRVHKYGNASRVKCYADGGAVKKNPLPAPKIEKVKDPIKKGSPGGPHTPGEREKRGERGGPIVRDKYADGGKVAKKGKKKPKPTPGMLGSGAAAKAGEAIRDTRKKQMKDLGI